MAGQKTLILNNYLSRFAGNTVSGQMDTPPVPGDAFTTFAALTRNQYDDWRARYFPRLQGLTALSNNNSLMNAQLARVNDVATSGLRTAQLAKANQMARYGVSRPDNPDSHTQGLRNALAIAGAKNGVREAEQVRQMNILTGGAAPVRQQMNIGGQTQEA